MLLSMCKPREAQITQFLLEPTHIIGSQLAIVNEISGALAVQFMRSVQFVLKSTLSSLEGTYDAVDFKYEGLKLAFAGVHYVVQRVSPELKQIWV